ncbi:protein kinase domain-containing protein [Microbacterium kribbense]
MGDPAQAQEAEALAKVHEMLPDDGVARAWANVTFTDDAGRLNEVDALLLTRAGLFVIELKGWNGQISGNQHEWIHAGRRQANPRILANAKAKRLASVLKDLAYKAGAPARTVPFVSEAIVLHGRDLTVSLDQFGAEHVWALDGFHIKGLGAYTRFSDFLKAPETNPIDLPRAKAIDALMNAAGLMPRVKQRMIGQYALDTSEVLGEGPGWQDFLVTHPAAETRRRIRLFPYPKGADRATRLDIDRRAQREFRLTDGISHPGIVGPQELFVTEEGSALVFAYDRDELSLADYLAAHTDDLTYDARERLVQDLIELVRFAHTQRLTHRALSPLSVRVKASANEPVRIRIRDWDLARRTESGTDSSTVVSRGITDLVGVVDTWALLYLAPETLRGATPASSQTLDVYGVGAVAFTMLTGQPPAVNLAAFESLVASGAKGLDPRAVTPQVSDLVAGVIIAATAFEEIHRLLDIVSVQSQFEQARADVAPKSVPALTDPLDASTGEIVGERFEIVRRRGSGSTGVALEVVDYDTERHGDILKLAKDDAAAARLMVEASILDRLDHPRIVKRLDGTLTVGTRQGLLMTDAGIETLADRIRLEGRATIEQLERYGGDLFDALAHLAERGVFHRDIKPSNLAVKPDPGSRKPHLTLFDFSLAEEPLANIRSGSRPYLDPYLGTGDRRQYDSAAERFAASATLFELATGDPVWWESGDAPASAADAPIVQASMFDSGVSDGLVTFFRTALAPDAKQRHATLESMRAAWVHAFPAAVADEGAVEANDAKAAATTLDTALADSGLSARALSAVARVNVTTVGELLGVPPMAINQIRGSGEQVRREISARVRQWRQRLTQTTTHTGVAAEGGRRAVELVRDSLAPRPEETPEAQFKRLRKAGTLGAVSADIARWLSEFENVATLHELAAKMLREYGSTLTAEHERVEIAIDVVGKTLEFDFRYREPRFVFQRTQDYKRLVVAYAPSDDSGLSFDEAHTHLESLLHAATVVDELLRTDDVISAPRLRETLRGRRAETVRLSEARINQIAIGLSSTGRISSMGEAYGVALTPARAVEHALRSAVTRELAISTIEQRVRARFPEVQEVPARPALDAAVQAAMPYLEWLPDIKKYGIRSSGTASGTMTDSSTTWGRPAGDPAIAARLRASLRENGALVLVVSWRRPLPAAAAALARSHGLQVVDLAEVALAALRETAVARRVQWPVVLKADGQDAATQDHRNLQQLARLAVTPVWREILASPEPMVFLNAAVLARWGLTDLIAEVTNLATARVAARWFLLPRPRSGGIPDLDGVPVPFGADGWIDLALDGLPTGVIDAGLPDLPATHPTLLRKASTP